MGRLRAGESLVSKLLSEGIPIYPPSPSKMSNGTAPRKRKKEIVATASNGTHSQSESLGCSESGNDNVGSGLLSGLGRFQSKKLKRTGQLGCGINDRQGKQCKEGKKELENQQSTKEMLVRWSSKEVNSMGTHTPSRAQEPLRVQNKREIIFPILGPELGPEPCQLSRLRDYPAARDDFYSSRLRESFSMEAKSIKKTLISSLTSGDVDNTDVDFMINLANAAFESLSSLHADFSHLYDAVRLFICYHCHLLGAKSEIEKNGCIPDMLARKANLALQSREAANALRGSKAAVAQANSNVAVLKARVEKTRKLLNQIEGNLAVANSGVVVLRAESDGLEKAYADVETEYQCFLKRIEEKMAIERKIDSMRNRIVDDIEKIRATLSSLY